MLSLIKSASKKHWDSVRCDRNDQFIGFAGQGHITSQAQAWVLVLISCIFARSGQNINTWELQIGVDGRDGVRGDTYRSLHILQSYSMNTSVAASSCHCRNNSNFALQIKTNKQINISKREIFII